ncbi:MAG: acyl-CoA dehydrogenase [Actinomycetia bacterium]|nr:acyl-CoA dehydrogenase [Actinomycetes bacterium]
MDFEFSTEQEQLRDSMRRFLAERAPITPYVRDQIGGAPDAAAARAMRAGLVELGVTGLLIPEEHGGAGMTMVDMAVVIEELGRAVFPGPFLSSAVVAASLIAKAGAPRDQAFLLPGIASGETVGTVALWEAGRRGNWARPAVTASATDDGWSVTGTKIQVPDGARADVVLVVAADPSVDGLGVFAVKTGGPNGSAPGVDVEPVTTVDLTRPVATITCTDAPAWRIGEGDATAAIAATVDRWITALVLDGLGAAARALEISVDYAKERRQFDQPIGAFQAVQHLCADMLRDVELGRAVAYYAAWADDGADAAERHRAATMAKAFASDGFYRVGASAVQVHGGIGFTWEHDIHLYYKRVLTLQESGGGTSDHLEELAAIALD